MLRPTGRRTLRLPLLILGLIVSVAWASGSSLPARVRALTLAEFVALRSSAPPPEDAGWQRRTLPDNWGLTRPKAGGEGWYRLAFELAADEIVMSAVCIPRLNMTGAVYLNGEFVGGATSFDEPVRRLWYVPQHYTLPARLLRRGTNVLDVRLLAYADQKGGLSEIHFGPAEPVARIWKGRYFNAVTAVQITSTITVGLGIMALFAWSLRRWNTAYGYFGLAAVLWGLRNLHFTVERIPVSPAAWEIGVATSLIWVLTLLFMFGMRFTGRRQPWPERVVWSFGAVAPLLLWAGSRWQLTAVVNLCYFVMLIAGAYLLKVMMDEMRLRRTVDAALLVLASLLAYCLGFHDWITHRDVIGFSEPYSLHYGAPVFFVAVAWNMLRRFNQAQRERDEIYRSLEARVEAKTAELASSYERAQRAESARLLVLERERIMRDMHDGVGSQLIVARELAHKKALRPEELESILGDCIDDLRLVIDSLEPVDGDLLALLANMRYRMEDRFARQGIALRWEVHELPRIDGLTPHATLQILRIVQEAFTNVVKHSGATKVDFSVKTAPVTGHFELTVRDNGRGMAGRSASVRGKGRGLANMQQRAQGIGVSIDIRSVDSGTDVVLTLPRELSTGGAGNEHIGM